MKLENVDEKSEADDNIEIPEGYPGATIKRQKVETLNVPEYSGVKRKRGRPPGSTNKTTTTASTGKISLGEVEQLFTSGVIMGYGIVTTALAARVFHNPKYKMTQAEAQSAARATVEVLFKYKQVRELAAQINTKSNVAILARGLAPYIMRAYLQEIIENVVSGFTFSPRQRAGNGPEIRRRNQSASNGNSEFRSGNVTPGSNGESSTEPPLPEILGTSDWRAL